MAETYGMVSSLHADPIEKKPLYHFYPGSTILSVGSIGCTLSCQFCQNCEISQVSIDEYPYLKEESPSGLASMSLHFAGNIGLAYTYNEPVVSYEFIRDTAPLIKEQGQKNVMVSNGFILKDPLGQLLPFIDAFNIDLKGFTEAFYRQYTRSQLSPVLETLKQIRKAGCHLEITNLIIPGLNDDEAGFDAMVRWIRDELGPHTVLHLSRYFPRYKMTVPSTPPPVLQQMYEIAHTYLPYVYVGNIDIPGTQDTRCTKCGALLVRRSGYSVKLSSLGSSGCCTQCGTDAFIEL